jgi:hypothetical protein
MNKALATFIEEFEASQRSGDPAAGDNDSIYDQKLKKDKPKFRYKPRCMYFYYVRLEPEGTLTVRHYFWPNVDPLKPDEWQPIEVGDLREIVTKRAQNARDEGQDPPVDPPPSINFSNIVWRHKSYVVIFIDEDKWTLHKKQNKKPPVVFNLKEGSTPNHTFYDADDFDVDMPVPGYAAKKMKCSVVYFINHMKREGGDDLEEDDGPNGDGREFYHFDLFFEVATTQGTNASMTVIIDPTGTNQGPPEDDPPKLVALPSQP